MSEVTGKPKTQGGCIVANFERAALDASTRRDVALSLQRAALPTTALVIDWSGVEYADILGLETLFDFLIERSGPVAFCGVNREIRHLFLRLQILPLIPIAPTPDEARRLIEAST